MQLPKKSSFTKFTSFPQFKETFFGDSSPEQEGVSSPSTGIWVSRLITNENKVKRKVQLKHVAIKRQDVSLPQKMVEEAAVAEAEGEGAKLSADQHAVLYICQRGHQSFISIYQGVNSTRVPIGKEPMKEDELRSILKDLEVKELLKKAEIHDQPTWTTTAKAQSLLV